LIKSFGLGSIDWNMAPAPESHVAHLMTEVLDLASSDIWLI